MTGSAASYAEIPPVGVTRKILSTKAGRIAIWERPGRGAPLLYVHGNSASKAAFCDLFAEPALADRHMVAMDLPGSGESPDSETPEAEYNIPAFARTVAAVIAAMKLDRPVLVGWSLGGHVAIEAAGQGVALRGLVLTGTPPGGPGFEEFAATFRQTEVSDVTSSESPTPRKLAAYVDALYGDTRETPEAFYRAAIRCDGRMRRLMVEHWILAREGVPQRKLVAEWPGPIAAIQGAAEPFFDPTILDGMVWKNLWRGKSQYIAGTGHAPFFEEPRQYATLLAGFLTEMVDPEA